jgi:arsenite/tail-anchored protein-transporting ATPase
VAFNNPSAIRSAPGLSALNIDPTAAAEAYRGRVIAQLGAGAPEEERSTVREELSGACTTEIDSFVVDESTTPTARVSPAKIHWEDLPDLSRLVDEIAASDRGLVMIMGKGGVGKTTVAAACAVGLVQRGHQVHLSTTDPAAHLLMTLEGELPGLRVDRIDPKAETERYVEKIMATRGAKLGEQGRVLLREDLRSPCTEEVVVFQAFSRIVSEARSAFVILDTAPTGHTLLLMDATGAYHHQIVRDLGKRQFVGRVITPLMRLQDHTSRMILVTLPETTPASEAGALQEDLRRAKIEPFAWVITAVSSAAGLRNPCSCGA